VSVGGHEVGLVGGDDVPAHTWRNTWGEWSDSSFDPFGLGEPRWWERLPRPNVARRWGSYRTRRMYGRANRRRRLALRRLHGYLSEGVPVLYMDEVQRRASMRRMGFRPGPIASWPVELAGRALTALVVWRMLERPRVISAIVGWWRWAR
jgi:hypothetical protein